MTDQAVAPAEAQPRPAEAASPQARIKSYLMAESGEPAQPKPAERTEARAEAPAAAEASKEPQAADGDESEASQEVEATETETEQTFETLSQLADGLGWDSDRIMDLAVATKIDGKEGSVKLRDAIKSFQLEGHLNQKLTAFADEKKAFESEALRTATELRGRVQYMSDAVSLAERLLHGEFAGTKWDELRAADPATYNAKAVEFQDRQQKIKQLADQIGQERARLGEEDAKSQATRFAEEQRLLETKLPEWTDKAKAQKDIDSMSKSLTEAYGISKEEILGLTDHRMILAARDAWKWQELQKSKPATLNKIKTAPKLLKPGTPQSRAAQQGLQTKQYQSRLRETGKVRDATPILRKLIFQ